MKWLTRLAGMFSRALLTLSMMGLLGLVYTYYFYATQLPDVQILKDMKMQVPLRIFSSDGKLMAEYGEKKRIPVPISEIPPLLVKAVLATEDQRFYDHPGVDPVGLVRAAVDLAAHGEIRQGGSTITMQVARNFFLTRQKTFGRKLTEILLAIKIDREFTKEKILDLYLNKIYFGHRAYGVGAASQIYYGKDLQDLTLAQLAMIAGLPKAPSTLNPLTNSTAAMKRREHVLSRMLENEYITQEQYEEAVKSPLTAKLHRSVVEVDAPYVTEMVRQAMEAWVGSDDVYTGGYQVYTTVDSKMQAAANRVVQLGLIHYTQRHGFRGIRRHVRLSTLEEEGAKKLLREISTVGLLRPGLVVGLNEHSARMLLGDGKVVNLSWAGILWARRQQADGTLGAKVNRASDVLTTGDVIYVYQEDNGTWAMGQLPRVEGALVAINPQNGAIRSLVGGFNFYRSKFNRVTQAERQAGSSFKPFIYAAALAEGFTLANTINDAPIVVDDPTNQDLWRPQNANRTFLGPTRIRMGLVKSRNLVSIRLLEQIGVPFALDYVSKFGFDPNRLPQGLSLALGTGLMTPMELTTAYAVFANGGFKVTPYFIRMITDSEDHVLFNANPAVACPQCGEASEQRSNQEAVHLAPRVIPARIAYLMNSALQDVIQSGTGRRARVLGREDLGGKTGTTNDKKDAWFAGFNADLAVTAWVGYDNPRSIREYSSRVALPIWADFMKIALHDRPPSTMPRPSGLVTIRINSKTGFPAAPDDEDVVFETFRVEYAPKAEVPESTNTRNSDSNGHNRAYEQLF